MWGFAAAMMVGSLIKMYGDYQAGKEQAKAELRNAEQYKLQAAANEQAKQRKLELYHREASDQIGAQQSYFAKAGVKMEGSAIIANLDMISRANEEKAAIRKEFDFNIGLASMRGLQSEERAASIKKNLKW